MSAKIDWTKPIQFENGEPLELVSIHPEGCPNFPDTTHIIFRPNETQPMAAMWHMTEDGLSGWKGFNVINRPETKETSGD